MKKDDPANSGSGTASPIRAPSTAQLDALAALAGARLDAGDTDTAVALCRLALSLQPQHLEARKGLARALFLREEWDAAWAAFDVRFELMDAPPTVAFRGPGGRRIVRPRWIGGPAPGSLLVMDEQGYGDTIQFCRFLADAVERGIDVTFVVKPALRSLVESMGLPIRILSDGEQGGSVSGIKGWNVMMDLPRALGLRPTEFGRRAPYLRADPARAEHWGERIGGRGFRVGIAWQGNPDKANDANRSMPLEQLQPLTAIEGVRLINLQKGFGTEQIESCSFRDRIETLGVESDFGPDAFLDTAALVSRLDLVVTVDTAVAHLAGALGRPVALLLSAVGFDWRWLSRARDTVWYPSMRLYRQESIGGWARVVARVVADLANPGLRDGLVPDPTAGPADTRSSAATPSQDEALACVRSGRLDRSDRLVALKVEAPELAQRIRVARRQLERLEHAALRLVEPIAPLQGQGKPQV